MDYTEERESIREQQLRFKIFITSIFAFGGLYILFALLFHFLSLG